MNITIDTRDLKKFEATLRTMKKSDFPLAIRGMLNDLAFDVKGRTMPNQWDKNFTVRRKTFLKSHSGVNRCANTFDISKMESSIGIFNKGSEIVADRVALQEDGGTIANRSSPTDNTRTGTNNTRTQKKALYYRNFKNAGVGWIASDRKDKSTIIKTKKGTIMRKKFGSYEKRNNKGQFLGDIEVLHTNKRTIKIEEHAFMLPSSMRTYNEKAQEYFEEQALKRISKHKI